MHHRIFWSRNSSQSSLEKIKANIRFPHFDKLKEDRNHHMITNSQINSSVKKLSLPKIKGMSVSLHLDVYDGSQKQRGSRLKHRDLLENAHSLDENRNVFKMGKSS